MAAILRNRNSSVKIIQFWQNLVHCT